MASSTAPGGVVAALSLCAVKTVSAVPDGPNTGSTAPSGVVSMTVALAASGMVVTTSPPRRRVSTPMLKHVKKAAIRCSRAARASVSRSASTRRCTGVFSTSVTLNGEPPTTTPR